MQTLKKEFKLRKSKIASEHRIEFESCSISKIFADLGKLFVMAMTSGIEYEQRLNRGYKRFGYRSKKNMMNKINSIKNSFNKRRIVK